MPGLLSTPDWIFTLRDCAQDSDSDSDDTNRKQSSDSDILKTMDLSSREDAAHYKPNPWAIAKMNAACRPPPPLPPPSSIGSEKKARNLVSQSTNSNKGRQITITQAVLKQTSQYGQSTKPSVVSRGEHVGKMGVPDNKNEGLGKAKTRLLSSGTKDTHIVPSAPAGPVKSCSTMSITTLASGNLPEELGDMSSLGGVEASHPSETCSARHIVQENTLCSETTSIQSLGSDKSYEITSNTFLTSSVKDSVPQLIPGAESSHHSVTNSTLSFPVPRVIAPASQYPVDHGYDEHCQTFTPDFKLPKTCFRRPMVDIKSRAAHPSSTSKRFSICIYYPSIHRSWQRSRKSLSTSYTIPGLSVFYSWKCAYYPESSCYSWKATGCYASRGINAAAATPAQVGHLQPQRKFTNNSSWSQSYSSRF